MITFLAAHHRRLDRARADGNCLFRSLSKQLFNNPEYHNELRKIITEFVGSNPELFSGWAIEGLSLQEHLKKMKAPGVWGSHLEILAAATLFGKTVYVATDSLVPHECRWTAFQPLPTLKPSGPKLCSLQQLPETSKQAWLEIAHSNRCHYDAILSDNICTPPVLTSKTIFVTEVL